MKIMTTSGYNFEGYEIREYLGVYSGETVLGTGFFSEFSASFADSFGTSSTSFERKLEQAKDAAMSNLEASVRRAGANAIIGLDIDYNMFAANLIGVIANGTAVRIEPVRREEARREEILPVVWYVPGARIRPVRAVIDGLGIALEIQIYGGQTCEALLADIRLTNLFGQEARLGEIAFFHLAAKSETGLWQTEFVSFDSSLARGMNAVDARLLRAFSRGREIELPGDPVRSRLTPFQLAEIKRTYGPDAFCAVSEGADGWQCLCGTLNKETDHCLLCGRVKGKGGGPGNGLTRLNLEALEKLEKGKEIYRFVAALESPPRTQQAATLLDALKTNAEMERIYGNMKSSSMKKIVQYLEDAERDR